MAKSHLERGLAKSHLERGLEKSHLEMRVREGLAKSHLEMRTRDTLGQLFEQRNHDFMKLCRLDHVQNLLQFVQKHDFFWAVDFWPEFQQAHHNLH